MWPRWPSHWPCIYKSKLLLSVVAASLLCNSFFLVMQEPDASARYGLWAPLGSVSDPHLQGRGPTHHGLRTNGQGCHGHRPDSVHWPLCTSDLCWTTGTQKYLQVRWWTCRYHLCSPRGHLKETFVTVLKDLRIPKDISGLYPLISLFFIWHLRFCVIWSWNTKHVGPESLVSRGTLGGDLSCHCQQRSGLEWRDLLHRAVSSSGSANQSSNPGWCKNGRHHPGHTLPGPAADFRPYQEWYSAQSIFS